MAMPVLGPLAFVTTVSVVIELEVLAINAKLCGGSRGRGRDWHAWRTIEGCENVSGVSVVSLGANSWDQPIGYRSRRPNVPTALPLPAEVVLAQIAFGVFTVYAKVQRKLSPWR
ncbi:hypothetical protein Micbo1qcDRAFT_177099 [Microdochium bolleyi]|uniref:Secreted protein n=1 Tax=Microdochium bolleyi TaxID=196109 RepID=A0A136IYF8_9PEZI|nr:hypothetical protein Micbo1qcDRAFT_177099 [Microdochium bolleyi]